MCLAILRLFDVKLEENEKKVKIASGFVLHVLTFMPNSTTSKLLSSTYSGGDIVCIGYGVNVRVSTLEIWNYFLFPQFLVANKYEILV